MIVELKIPFFSLLEGTRLERIDGTLETQVCDVCGQKKRCDWYVPCGNICHPGMNICKSCAKKLEVKE